MNSINMNIKNFETELKIVWKMYKQKKFVTKEMLEIALDYLVEIEPHPETYPTMKEYRKIIKPFKKNIKIAEQIVKTYGEQIEPKTLSNMQEVYYSITNLEKYLASSLSISVVTATIGSQWNGIGPWKN